MDGDHQPMDRQKLRLCPGPPANTMPLRVALSTEADQDAGGGVGNCTFFP